MCKHDGFITVIIPAFNRSKVISATLDSLVSQTYKNFEVIIVDDCSSDYHLLSEVVSRYESILKIKIFKHEVNKNGAAARNTGIKLATGKYIAFLDSDDIWDKDKLKLCIEKNIEFNEIVYSKICDKGVVYPIRPIKNSEFVDEYLILHKGCMQTSSLFMHRVFCEKIMFDHSLRRFQDYDFVIRAQKIHYAKFVFLDKVLVTMTDNDAGNRISNSVDYRVAVSWLEKVKSHLTNKSISVFAFNRVINYACETGTYFIIIKLFFLYKCWSSILYLNGRVFIKIITGAKFVNFIRLLRNLKCPF